MRFYERTEIVGSGKSCNPDADDLDSDPCIDLVIVTPHLSLAIVSLLITSAPTPRKDPHEAPLVDRSLDAYLLYGVMRQGQPKLRCLYVFLPRRRPASFVHSRSRSSVQHCIPYIGLFKSVNELGMQERQPISSITVSVCAVATTGRGSILHCYLLSRSLIFILTCIHHL